MREKADTKTRDMLPDADLAGDRPAKPTQREKTAKRVHKYREKNGLAAMTVNIPADLLADFNAYLGKTGKNRSEVVAHALRTQVLRKR